MAGKQRQFEPEFRECVVRIVAGLEDEVQQVPADSGGMYGSRVFIEVVKAGGRVPVSTSRR
ncbi:hypothetical protein ABZ769_36000 [Streptomyces olivoreticuli]